MPGKNEKPYYCNFCQEYSEELRCLRKARGEECLVKVGIGSCEKDSTCSCGQKGVVWERGVVDQCIDHVPLDNLTFRGRLVLAKRKRERKEQEDGQKVEADHQR